MVVVVIVVVVVLVVVIIVVVICLQPINTEANKTYKVVRNRISGSVMCQI